MFKYIYKFLPFSIFLGTMTFFIKLYFLFFLFNPLYDLLKVIKNKRIRYLLLISAVIFIYLLIIMVFNWENILDINFSLSLLFLYFFMFYSFYFGFYYGDYYLKHNIKYIVYLTFLVLFYYISLDKISTVESTILVLNFFILFKFSNHKLSIYIYLFILIYLFMFILDSRTAFIGFALGILLLNQYVFFIGSLSGIFLVNYMVPSHILKRIPMLLSQIETLSGTAGDRYLLWVTIFNSSIEHFFGEGVGSYKKYLGHSGMEVSESFYFDVLNAGGWPIFTFLVLFSIYIFVKSFEHKMQSITFIIILGMASNPMGFFPLAWFMLGYLFYLIRQGRIV